MSMMLLLEAAVRSFVMALIIWLAMRALRIRQVRAQRAAWLLALGGALFMPLLAGLQIGPRVLPAPAVVESPAQSPRFEDGNNVREAGMREAGAAGAIQAVDYAAGIYLAVAGLLVLRLAVGLRIALRIRRQATRIDCSLDPRLDPRLDVRVSDRLAAPVTIGSSIVLPKGFARWQPDTLRIVLSHERAHVRHGDFYVQLLAGLHCALFWFSPFSWWLRRQLSDLGEALSDHAAVQHAESRASYAEILLAFARGCSEPAPAAGVAMARSGNLTARIERLLNERGFHQCFAPRRRAVLIAGAVAALALAAATSVARVQAAAMHGFVNSDESYAGSDAEAAAPAASPESDMPPLAEPPAAPSPPKPPAAPGIPEAPSPPAHPAAALLREWDRAQQELVTPDFKKDIEELNQVVTQMKLAETAPQIRPESLVELQSKLARIQGHLAAAQGQVAIRRQAAVLRSLTEQQARLKREMGRLSEQQRRLIEQTMMELKPLLEKTIREGLGAPAG